MNLLKDLKIKTMKPKMIIVRHSKKENSALNEETLSYADKSQENRSIEQTANTLMSDAGFKKYIKKHGYHFTDMLAEHISNKMINDNGQQHTWKALEVKKAMEGLGLNIPYDSVTLGDVTYLANMYYSDFYPDILKSEVECLKAAYKIAVDIDGYNGMAFCRWISDAVGKNIKINWLKFI